MCEKEELSVAIESEPASPLWQQLPFPVGSEISISVDVYVGDLHIEQSMSAPIRDIRDQPRAELDAQLAVCRAVDSALRALRKENPAAKQ